MLKRYVLAIIAIFCVTSTTAAYAACSSYPYTFSNGTTADAGQVNSNFNNIMSCANSVLAPIASPSFTGTPTAPTAAITDNTTQLATDAFINSHPQFQASLAANQTGLSSGAWVKVQLPAATIDVGSNWSAANNYYVVPITGTYRLGGAVDLVVDYPTSSSQGAAITKNGIPGTGTILGIAITQALPANPAVEHTLVLPFILVKLTAGDHVQLNAVTAFTGSGTINSGSNVTQMTIEWVGP